MAAAIELKLAAVPVKPVLGLDTDDAANLKSVLRWQSTGYERHLIGQPGA